MQPWANHEHRRKMSREPWARHEHRRAWEPWESHEHQRTMSQSRSNQVENRRIMSNFIELNAVSWMLWVSWIKSEIQTFWQRIKEKSARSLIFAVNWISNHWNNWTKHHFHTNRHHDVFSKQPAILSFCFTCCLTCAALFTAKNFGSNFKPFSQGNLKHVLEIIRNESNVGMACLL